jgi:hypothetical protein
LYAFSLADLIAVVAAACAVLALLSAAWYLHRSAEFPGAAEAQAHGRSFMAGIAEDIAAESFAELATARAKTVVWVFIACCLAMLAWCIGQG